MPIHYPWAQSAVQRRVWGTGWGDLGGLSAWYCSWAHPDVGVTRSSPPDVCPRVPTRTTSLFMSFYLDPRFLTGGHYCQWFHRKRARERHRALDNELPGMSPDISSTVTTISDSTKAALDKLCGRVQHVFRSFQLYKKPFPVPVFLRSLLLVVWVNKFFFILQFSPYLSFILLYIIIVYFSWYYLPSACHCGSQGLICRILGIAGCVVSMS